MTVDDRVHEGVPTQSGQGSGPLSPLMAWILVIVAGLVWGLSFSLVKIAVAGGAHPISITLWQAGFGAAMIVTVSLFRRRHFPLGGRAIAFYLLCGLLGTAIPTTFFFYAGSHLSAGVLSILIATVPMLTLSLALPLGQEAFEKKRLAGVVIGLLAVALIAIPELSLPKAGALFWVFVVLAAAGCYALENLLIAMRSPTGSDTLSVLTGMMVAGAALMIPAAWATGTFEPLAWPFTSVEWALLGMAAINVFAYGLFFFLVKNAGPVFASQTAYAVTISGVFWGIVIFGERHSSWVWAALVIMLIGLLLVKPKNS